MAVIEELEGLEAWVTINGQRAQEYDNPNEDDGDNDLQLLVSATKLTNPVGLNVQDIPHVVKYIESIPDQKFVVKFKKAEGFTRQCNHLGVTWILDKEESGLVHEPLKRDRKSEWINGAGSIVTGSDKVGWTENQFKFSEVKHVDVCDLTTESMDKAMGNSKHYGLIAVLVYRMSSSDVIKCKAPGSSPPIGLPQEVPEKAFKGAAVTNCTTFEQKPADRPKWADGYQEDIYQDPLKQPFAVFQFRYRSMEGLYQEGVLKRPDPVDSMSIDELRRLARVGYSHESTDLVKKDGDHKIKQEDGEGSSNRKRSASGTVEPPRKRYKETVRDDGKVEVDLE